MTRWTRGARRAGASLVASLIVLGGCGKKGPPLPPLRPTPARIADLAARVADGAITLSFTVPSSNADGSSPIAIERVEVYRDVALRPAATGEVAEPGAPRAPAPVARPLVSPENLVGTLRVAAPGREAAPAAGAVTPGQAVTWTDPAVLPAIADPDDAPTWRYVVLPVEGRDRRPGPSNLVQVPLGGELPDAVEARVSYDERSWLVEWDASDDVSYLVFDLPRGGGDATRLTATPVATSPFSEPVEFGRERCFAVRPVVVRGGVTFEGPASAPACGTPVDTFAPPAPGGVLAVQEGAAVVLRWSAVTAADLGGYIILRGEGQGATLTPLVTTPVAGTSYRDEAVRAGVTYIYAVVAIDRATPPNTSGESNRETIVVRDDHHGS